MGLHLTNSALNLMLVGLRQSHRCNFNHYTQRGMIKSMSIAFYLPGGLPVYTFSLLVGLGSALGLAWVARQAPQEQARRYMDAGLAALLGALMGGRALFVAAHWNYFQAHLAEIPQVFLGGLAWGGALGGGLLTLGLAAALTRIPFADLADGMIPLSACLGVSTWLGCWLVGCAYGPAANTWWGIPARDEWGELASRWPTQLVGALLTLAMFWLLDWGRSRFRYVGQAASLGVLGLSLEMLALAYLRADPLPAWRGLPLDAWTALAFSVLAGGALLVFSASAFTRNEDRHL